MVRESRLPKRKNLPISDDQTAVFSSPVIPAIVVDMLGCNHNSFVEFEDLALRYTEYL